MTASATTPAATTEKARLHDPAKPQLWEKFGLYGRQNQVYDVKLFEDRLSVVREDSSGGSALELLLRDVIGCHLMKCKDPDDSAAYFIVYAYPEKKQFGQPKRRERQTLTFVADRFVFFDLNLETANRWKAAILRLKSANRPVTSSLSDPGRSGGPRRCLVLLNPFGGKGKALTSFTEQVAPVLAEAEMQYNMIVTERPGHAQELIQSIALEEWKCALICSGDGLIYEVFNGLLRRPDWRRAIQFPVGVIPCGTGNALAASILWRSGESLKSAALIPSAAFIVTQQLLSPLDLILVETRSARFYSFLSICYGLIADVDIESEKYRKLGVVRNILGGLVRILDLRTYRCRISYLPPSSTSGASGNRFRAESSGEQKRRHVSDSNIGRGLPGRRRSKNNASQERRSISSRRQSAADVSTASISLPNPSASSLTPPSSSSLTAKSPSHHHHSHSETNDVGVGPAVDVNQVDDDDARPAFTHSMSVPNVFFHATINEGVPSSPPPSPSSPPVDDAQHHHHSRSHSAILSPSSLSSSSNAVSSAALRRHSSHDSSGYTSADSPPPDGSRSNASADEVLPPPGLEPIVEIDDDDDGEVVGGLGGGEEKSSEGVVSNGEVRRSDRCIVKDSVIYDVPIAASSPLQHRKPGNYEEDVAVFNAKDDGYEKKTADDTGNDNCVENDGYEQIDLTPTRLSPIDADVPNKWITMETEIVSANVINISHLSSETVAYTGAGINDGQIFIYLIRAGISKAGLLQMLASMDSNDPPADHPFVDIFPCDAFRLEPLVEGILTVDGEVIPCSTIQGEVLPGMARVMVGEDKTAEV